MSRRINLKWSRRTGPRIGLALIVSAPLAPAGAIAPADAATRRFEITARKYEFAPSRIEVSEGDAVELVLRSADTVHGIAIKPYKVKVKIPKGGETVVASFVASQPGTFTIECSEYCGSGHRRMRGELVVREAGR